MSSTISHRSFRADTMSRSMYIRAIAFFTLIVSTIVGGASALSYGWTMSWPLLLAAFVGSIVCIVVFQSSKNPAVSFVGVSGMSVALGFIIGPVLHSYKMETIVQSVVLTAVVMGAMSVVGILVPQLFRGVGPYLLGALSLLIVAQFAQIIFISAGFKEAAHIPILNWLGIGIFTMYVAYDWSAALDKEYTLDNAIDASGGLVLDAVNLFLRFSAASGSSSSSDD